MGQTFLGLIIVAVVFFAIQVAMLRWIFRINHSIKLLESIDETLRLAPWMRRIT
jgi:hypothetical protein